MNNVDVTTLVKAPKTIRTVPSLKTTESARMLLDIMGLDSYINPRVEISKYISASRSNLLILIKSI